MLTHWDHSNHDYHIAYLCLLGPCVQSILLLYFKLNFMVEVFPQSLGKKIIYIVLPPSFFFQLVALT